MTESAVLGAKLAPPRSREEHLRRPRLERRLADGLETRATVVVAGPGYGKSTLVAQFLRESQIPYVWYSLDPSDQDPWLFLQYLLHGIRAQVPEFGEKSAGLWESLRYREEQVERSVDLLLRDAEESLSGRLVLVLDRVEAIAPDAPSAAALKRLLSYSPGALHVMLVGRALPRVGLQGLLADGAARAIEPEELRFDLDETRALLVERFGLALPDATIARLHGRLRGWVTALQLLRHTARLSESAAFPADLLERTETEVFDYFSEEVLGTVGAEARAFLLATSILPAIDPQVVSEVLGTATTRGALELMKERRLFFHRLEGTRELYAFDPLFHDFLLAKANAELGADGIRKLHHRFGTAYQHRDELFLALDHFRRAGSIPEIAALLESRGRSLIRGGSLDAVRDAATFLSERGVSRASAEDLLGEVCRLRGDFAPAVGHFRSAIDRPQASGAALTGVRLAEALQGLAYSLLRMGDTPGAAEVAERGLAAAGGEDPGLAARILNTLSIVRYRTDRTREAIAGWQDALTRARLSSDDHLTRMIAHNLGLPHAARGDFRRATECFGILTAPENPRLGPEEGAAYLNLARIATLRGDYDGAARLLDDAWEIRRKWNLRSLAADVLEAQGTLARETGEYAAAEEKYAAARAAWIELGQLDVLDSLGEEEAVLAARRGEHDRAARTIAEIVERARESGRSEAIASALLAQGEVRARSGAPEAGIAPLEEARSRFAELDRAYQQCAASLWLGLAAARSGDIDRAREAAARALELSATFGYEGLIRRVVASEPRYHRVVLDLPGAPDFLREPVPTAQAEAEAARRRLDPERADLTVRLLGPVEVFRDAESKIPANAWRLKRALKVFCYLAAARNHRASKDRIADAVWNDSSTAVVERNFHPTISFLRRALNQGHTVAKNFVLCEGGAYSLNPAYRYEIDAESFDRGIAAARAARTKGDLDGALAAYAAAIPIHRGPFLEEDDDSWAAAPRAHFETLLDTALREAAELLVRQGRHDHAVPLLERLVERNPSDQESSVVFMQVLGGLGRRSDLEKEYRRLQRATDAAAASGLRLETVLAFRRILARTATPG